jgi:hypothetical protein
MEEKKRRRALTDAGRFLIRKRNQTHPPTQQQDLAEWVAQETGHTINQTIISKVLSSKYDYLDGINARKDKQMLW